MPITEFEVDCSAYSPKLDYENFCIRSLHRTKLRLLFCHIR